MNEWLLVIIISTSGSSGFFGGSGIETDTIQLTFQFENQCKRALFNFKQGGLENFRTSVSGVCQEINLSQTTEQDLEPLPWYMQ